MAGVAEVFVVAAEATEEAGEVSVVVAVVVAAVVLVVVVGDSLHEAAVVDVVAAVQTPHSFSATFSKLSK